ncbi:MAG: aminopeptidase P family protein [Candidatus Fusobacterium pullicola]|uniref:Aminopeptidase P family protein n=1 Tax=Candidatus Fusobacterium pullicola TaxID=2838601 RepID=A0A9E2NY46_9FUSO|nr:aminopeptidase P family protein [Candidatus Fusobacterium pullicola]
MKITERIAKLKELMKERGIDYYIIPSADYHQSEYVGDYFKGREWISGFTGSAGTVVVTQNEVGLWTDGRYFIQAEKQLQGSGITLFKMGEEGVPTFIQYIVNNIQSGETLGFDGKVLATNTVLNFEAKFKDKKVNFNFEFDLVGEIWRDRPSLPASQVFVLEEKFTGESVEKKLTRVRNILEEENCDVNIITSLDDIAWIFNIRGNDVKNNPVNLAYAAITVDKAVLYIGEEKLNSEVEKYLYKNGVEVRDYFEIYEDMERVSNSNIIMMDLNKVNYTIFKKLNPEIKVINRSNPSTIMKACKNKVELENLRNSHVKDGVAVTKFMYWLKNSIGKEEITEMSATQKLESFRKEQELYIEPSFDTIAAYESNAAMMHYKSTPETDRRLEAKNLFLVDSGGQYFDGTTDITRTFVLGECSEELKKHFTLVLKGMINLSKVKFLYGVTGTNLDILARQALWNIGIDYKCGTGHGVGFLLNVHEGPQGIRVQYNPQVLEEGMNVTNEPGVYIAGSHGIRLENELIVQKAEKTEFGQFMKFETMTYAPLDLDGVIKELLSKEEIEYLNNYHQMVYEKVSPYLTLEEKEWLKEYTRAI